MMPRSYPGHSCFLVKRICDTLDLEGVPEKFPAGREMKITITMRGTLKKYMPGEAYRVVEVPDNCTCDEALQCIGMNYREIPRFGFVVRNGMRCSIFDRLEEGDELKAWSQVSGG